MDYQKLEKQLNILEAKMWVNTYSKDELQNSKCCSWTTLTIPIEKLY